MANCTDPIDKRIKESELAEDFFVNVLTEDTQMVLVFVLRMV